VADAPLLTAEGKLPLLVFSHGYTGYSSQNTPQMEELASRGYAVFSISHSYDAAATVFPDGRVIPLDPGIIRGFGAAAAPEAAKKTMAALAQLNHASTPEERHTAFREYMVTGLPRIEQSVPVWAGDTRFLLDYLERVQPDQPAGRFSGHLDFDRVGIFGMSFGGSNAGEVCLIDRRCKAGLNIDGQQYGPLIDDSLSVPFMILASETAYGVHRAIYDRFQGPAYLIRLRGTQHVGLTDLPYLGPILFRKLGLTGTMPVDRSEQLMTDYIVAFFDTYLRGKPSALLGEPNPGPDVEVLVKNR
jgi:predicted dienelactone hydrolase